MMKHNILPIASAGFRYIASAVVLFILFALLDLDFLALVSFGFILLFLYLYRNPEREFDIYEQYSFLSPVDGEILSVKELKNDEEFGYKIVVKSNYKDLSILRVPFDGTLSSIKKSYGTRLSHKSPLASKLNESLELIFSDVSSRKTKIIHQSDRNFDSVHLNIIEGKMLRQTNRYGFLLNGTTTIYTPKNFRINVHAGNSLYASTSILGYFIPLP